MINKERIKAIVADIKATDYRLTIEADEENGRITAKAETLDRYQLNRLYEITDRYYVKGIELIAVDNRINLILT